MSGEEQTTGKMNQEELDNLVAATDTGGRTPDSAAIVKFLAATALTWSLWQVWIASPLPFLFNFGVFSGKEARPIHLSFSILLAFMAYPAFKNSPRNTIPLADWLLAAGAF